MPFNIILIRGDIIGWFYYVLVYIISRRPPKPPSSSPFLAGRPGGGLGGGTGKGTTKTAAINRGSPEDANALIGPVSRNADAWRGVTMARARMPYITGDHRTDKSTKLLLILQL